MTLRKKKVEATLDKLFSTSKPKTEGVEGPTPKPSHLSPKEPEEADKSRSNFLMRR